MQNQASRRQRGFSLAEVLVAVALLSVILLGMFGLVTAGVRRAYGGKKMTEAANLAQAVMDRVNVMAPQTLLSAASTATSAQVTWTRTGAGNANVTPAAEAGANAAETERNVWRTMFVNASLPYSAALPTTMQVTLTPVPGGRNFGNSAAIRVAVDVTWAEYGTRRRQVRLQTLNVRSADL